MPHIDQIPAELTQAGGKTLHSEKSCNSKKIYYCVQL